MSLGQDGPDIMVKPPVTVVRTYLELTDPSQLVPSPVDERIIIVRQTAISVQQYRRLYRDVGYRWYWRDRDDWTDETMAAYLTRSDVSVWECQADGETAGFFELVAHDDSVEIAYFGLVEAAMGRGIGKAMLTCAVREAWTLGRSRVWLHTCTLDSPRALPNYLARGFRKVNTETYSVQLPDD